MPSVDDLKPLSDERGGMTIKTKSLIRMGTVLVAATALVVGVTGCATPFSPKPHSVWMPTYTITTTGGETVSDVIYDSGQDQILKRTHAGTQKLNRRDDGTLSWQKKVPVTATRTAYVAATPESGFTATCRIVAGGKVLVTATGAPGARVTCEKATPAMR